jgi:membrane protein DedA with SNARE-associated domain
MAEAILSFISEWGYPGIFLLMVLENVFPPIPSEVILPFIGHLAATGEFNFWIALVCATAGSMVGTSIWFLLGWLIPVPVLEKFFTRFGGYVAIDVKDFKMATKFFTKYELPAVLFGRMIPTVRSVISVPAGCVRMPIKTFLLLSTLGTVVWNMVLIGAGYFFLDDNQIVDSFMKPVADGIIILFISLYVIQVLRFLWRRRIASRTHEITK